MVTPTERLLARRKTNGVEGSEMMGAVQAAMLGGLPYTVLRDAIFTHPATAEGLVGLLARVPALPQSSNFTLSRIAGDVRARTIESGAPRVESVPSAPSTGTC
jgi:hypothetical protein